MHDNQQNHTEEQIQDALEAATIGTAIKLWETRDWPSYMARRDLLVSLIRSGEGDRVGLPHMQFIYFVNTHLRPLWPGRTRDQHVFLSGLPEGRGITDTSWQTATKGDFWSIPL